LSAIADAGVRILSAVERLAILPLDWLREQRKRAACEAARDARMLPESSIVNPQGKRAAIRVGAGTHLYGRLLVFPKSGEIVIGAHCYIGPGAQIWSAGRVTIGDRVFMSHGVNVHDNNAHPMSARLRHIQFVHAVSPQVDEAFAAIRMAPVVIEDDAWVGFNATVLKGVTIGRGAVVGAASVVTADVPPWTVVAGNPARPIGSSEH
jgi:acetyltransferase-like isoleucine patch superfamily enzyme